MSKTVSSNRNLSHFFESQFARGAVRSVEQKHAHMVAPRKWPRLAACASLCRPLGVGQWWAGEHVRRIGVVLFVLVGGQPGSSMGARTRTLAQVKLETPCM